MSELAADRSLRPLPSSHGIHRRRTLAAILAIALAICGCTRNLTLPASIAEALDRGGLTLEVAWLAAAPVTRDVAIQSARAALTANDDDGTITAVDLVTVRGPGNGRLGWNPADEPLAYAIQWTADSAVGLVLVSARTGKVLLFTAY